MTQFHASLSGKIFSDQCSSGFFELTHFGTMRAALSCGVRKIIEQNYLDYKRFDNYKQYGAELGENSNFYLYEVKLDLGDNILRIDMDWNTPYLKGLTKVIEDEYSHIKFNEKLKVASSNSECAEIAAEIAAVIVNNNYTAISYKNEIEDKGQESYIILKCDSVSLVRIHEYSLIDAINFVKNNEVDFIKFSGYEEFINAVK